jgi:hypothetical protein
MNSSRMPRPKQSDQVKLDAAIRLLSPTIDFLFASGLEDQIVRAAFERAWSGAHDGKKLVRISSLNHWDICGDVVSAWMTNQHYLDPDGNPSVLKVRGRRSFTSLLRSVDKKISVTEAIIELKRFGNIRRLPGDRVKLKNIFLHVSSDSALAFEPHCEFLANASATVGALLANPASEKKRTSNFWRVAEELELPRSQLEPFIRFMRGRSLTFLQEVDEWLRAKSGPRQDRSPRVRAGVGLFTYGRPGS